jgi:hypothetical protein
MKVSRTGRLLSDGSKPVSTALDQLHFAVEALGDSVAAHEAPHAGNRLLPPRYWLRPAAVRPRSPSTNGSSPGRLLIWPLHTLMVLVPVVSRGDAQAAVLRNGEGGGNLACSPLPMNIRNFTEIRGCDGVLRPVVVDRETTPRYKVRSSHRLRAMSMATPDAVAHGESQPHPQFIPRPLAAIPHVDAIHPAGTPVAWS